MITFLVKRLMATFNVSN